MRRTAHVALLTILAANLAPAVASRAAATTVGPQSPPLIAVFGVAHHPGVAVMTTNGKLLPDRTLHVPPPVLAISPDGRQLAYDIGLFEVAIRPVDASRRTAVVPRADDPAWSADGQELAVDGYGPGAPHDVSNIFTVRPGHPKQLFYRDRAWDTNPTWAPDGKSIAFERDRADGEHAGGRNGIFVSDGTTRRLLISDAEGVAFDPAWSPDGREIAFDDTMHGAPLEFGERTSDIYLINADGTNLRQVTFDARRSDDEPHWSPDGRELAFTVTGAARSAVGVKTIGASAPKCLLHPTWSHLDPIAWLPGDQPTPPPANCARTILPPRPKPRFGCTRPAARSAVDRSNLPYDVKAYVHDGSGGGFSKRCLDFTRDGRQDLAVLFDGGGSGGVIAWAAFRRTRHDWKRVLYRQGDRLAISVVGHDLIETNPVYRPNDCHCDPTGGVAHREYGWNGHRLVVVARWHTAS